MKRYRKSCLTLREDSRVELVWPNELGGLTFGFDDRFVKWNPRSTGIDLERERVRLEWIAPRHPAPVVIDSGADELAQWPVTAALPGDCAVGDAWRARRPEAIRAIAAGLRAIHTISIDGFTIGSRDIPSPQVGCDHCGFWATEVIEPEELTEIVG